MYSYEWDEETGGLLLNSSPLSFSKEPRPVYYKELDILGFDKYWNYDKNDTYPYMWAESNNYWYRGRLVAKTKGGSLYSAPELIIVDEPEPNNEPLRFVDVPRMVEKNKDLLEKLTQETIKKVFNTYVDFKDKVDVFYVAFSGGKDSIVALDIVQRALPHNNFKVLFGDTDMEFPATYSLADMIEKDCSDTGIEFIRAKSSLPAAKSWDLFGPPARKLRWCCTVHKTVPVINKLCEILELDSVKSVMITGVRADESVSRSNYDELSLGKKIQGQYSYHPLIDWTSAEIFMYIYSELLPLNEAYKLGFNRVGCIMCPNSSEKHEYIKSCNYPEQVGFYAKKILNNSSKDLSGDNARAFLDTGGWKTRLSGRELNINEKERFELVTEKNIKKFVVKNLNSKWEIWYKTIGKIEKITNDEFILEYDGVYRKCVLLSQGKTTIFEINDLDNKKNSLSFISLFKCILAKTMYCIGCMTCVAECPHGNIRMDNDTVEISEKCTHCKICLKKISSGCIYYNSIKGSNDMKSLKGINRYLSVGVDSAWIKQYLRDNNFEPGNRKTDVMFGFLKDAGIVEKKKLTNFGDFIRNQDINSNVTWALILCNLAYTVAFGWYIHNIPFNQRYIEERLVLDMGENSSVKDGGKKARSEFWNSFKVILSTNEEFRELGLGEPEIISKQNINGEVKKKLVSITRTPWQNPDPRVILYSLYKFAENCGDYYQFTLSRLLNHEIDSDGVSPTEIFGIDREQMERILNGLSVNYPQFITVSFTLDLDNITLRNDKTSKDVLELF